MAAFIKTAGAMFHHIVLNLEKTEVAIVQNDKTKLEHLFNLILP